MREQVFERFRAIIYKESGIALGEEKVLLLQNRIRKRLHELHLNNEEEYLSIIEFDVDGGELVHLIDAISTNLTFFFREKAHFEFFSTLLREDRPPGEGWKIWCAAASSGEEPYSLAMTAMECLDIARNPFRLLASDICTVVLQKALLGIYDTNQLREVSGELKEKYFDRIQMNGQMAYRVRPDLRDSVLFKRLNLSQFPYPLTGSFDVIFCRNVMIYFDDELRTKLVHSFHRLLKPGGYLFVGHSESLSLTDHQLIPVMSAVYQKMKGGEHAY